MALVLSESDYRRLTLFTKIVGVFTFAAGTIMMVDYGRAVLGLGLVAFGIFLTLAPVPMSVVRPDMSDDEPGDDELLTVNE